MNLSDFFEKNSSGALAFSGGTDSSLLVWAAAKYGQNWRAYYVYGAFQPAFELEDAEKIADHCALPMTIIEADVLSDPRITANPANRCYYCKHTVFSLIQSAAAADGYTLLIDGTNASDEEGDRPGMQALRELRVRSPLRECGITKQDVRALSREAGLFTWNKPSYACLATRIPTGTEITAEKLQKVEQGELALFEMGFSDFRIRLRGDMALVQLPESQFSQALKQREEILSRLSPQFSTVALDLKSRL